MTDDSDDPITFIQRLAESTLDPDGPPVYYAVLTDPEAREGRP